MDWTALFEMLKQFVGSDPTMLLLLGVLFFFLQTIWPSPKPASKQILDGYGDRIRALIAAGNEAGAKSLANDAVEAVGAQIKQELQPKASGILDIFKGLFGNSTLMPLLLIGGLFLVMMLGQGGCQKPASATPPDAVEANPAATFSELFRHESPIRFAVHRSGAVGPAVDSGMPVGAGWAWADGPAWAWADGEAFGSGNLDHRGRGEPDAGAGRDPDRSQFASVGGDGGGTDASCRSGGSQCSGGTVRVAPAVGRLAFVRGQPVRNAARAVARPFRWIRLPGRPVARLFGCR